MLVEARSKVGYMEEQLEALMAEMQMEITAPEFDAAKEASRE